MLIFRHTFAVCMYPRFSLFQRKGYLQLGKLRLFMDSAPVSTDLCQSLWF